MSLFQSSVLKKYLNQQDKEAISKAYKKFSAYFHNSKIQENIRDSKEEQFQEGFLRELFVNVFGYTLNPRPNYNLTTEFKNERGAKKADGAILKDGKAIGVIELKGTETKDLDKVRQQAFDYKANQTNCIYVITSNFEKLRFYIDNAVEFEEFNLFELNEDRFELLYLCLANQNLLENTPQRVKKDSLQKEEAITKEFYSDYSIFKRELFRDLVKLNMKNEVFREEINREDKERAFKNIKLTLFKKSQKLIDRFLFIFFAEDRGLLPPNSTLKILQQWNKLTELDEIVPLYSRFIKYFNYLDQGRKGTDKTAEIFAYNGGLFKPDPTLDSLAISDELLYKHAEKLSNYDFESQVDVNILGHIFENSLNEIESINAEIEGKEFEKQKTKRKKDGVFYTPKYITNYIVDNTLGKLCEEKKKEIGLIDEEYTKSRKGRHTKKLQELSDRLNDYRNWLLGLKICDPACGSGAFLNQALDFLIKEHAYLDELNRSLLGGGFLFPDIENTILEKNIYGVDINEESVEIAKLSLWLRTAQPRRKLNDLSSNIKCGNSLISSKSVAGDNAFTWKDEFVEVFKNGGFDIVIGNPPYVGEKGHSEVFERLKSIDKWNTYYRRRSNLYYFFIKLGIELLKDNGIQSLIIPREFTSADWSNKVRFEIINTTQILSIVDFNKLKVFSDAGTTSLILTHTKRNRSDYYFDFISLEDQGNLPIQLSNPTNQKEININAFDITGEKPWNLYQDQFAAFQNGFSISSFFDVSQGLVTGSDKVTKKHVLNNLIEENFIGRGIFILTEGIDIRIEGSKKSLLINDNWIKLSNKEAELIKPFIKTENLKKWFVKPTNHYVIYTGDSELFGSIKEYLLQFVGILINRSTTIAKNEVITLDDFQSFTSDQIKSKYSSAGAVQKIMRRKMWWMPLYERANIPFEDSKIIVNTKNMDSFTFSNESHYSTGGGAGGQNYIYIKEEVKKAINEFTTIREFVLLTNGILNSKLIKKYIKDGKYNQLSTSKISDLPFISLESIKKSQLINHISDFSSTLNDLIKGIEEINESIENYLITKFSVELDLDLLDGSFNILDYFKRQNIKIPVNEELEWTNLIKNGREKVNELKNQIININSKIDEMVYSLYNLKDEEIQLIDYE